MGNGNGEGEVDVDGEWDINETGDLDIVGVGIGMSAWKGIRRLLRMANYGNIDGVGDVSGAGAVDGAGVVMPAARGLSWSTCIQPSGRSRSGGWLCPSDPSRLPFPQLVLLPRVSELPGFHGAEAAARQEELERYQCLEVFRMAPPHPLAQACARLVCSVSALMHGGALREWAACRDGTDKWAGVEPCLGQWVRFCPCPQHGGQESSGRAWAGVGRCR